MNKQALWLRVKEPESTVSEYTGLGLSPVIMREWNSAGALKSAN